DQHHLLKALNLALLDFARQKKRVVVCLDETQAMPLESLETLRLLTNLETEKRKLVQVILFGQPELDQRLAHESIRQLRQRITFQHHLGTLTREETHYYLAHRLAIAGYSGEGVFAPGAVKRIYRGSRGVPRLVNILANKAMMLAYGEGSRRVTARHVWQLPPPHPIVPELAYQPARGRAPAPADVISPRSDPAPAREAPALQPAPTPSLSSPAADPPPRVAQTRLARADKVNVDMLRLATELTAPIPQRSTRTPSSRSGSKAPTGAAKAVAARAAPAGDPAAAPGKIDRRPNTSSRNRAESEFRRAVNLVNQGRIAEGTDGFRRALEIDPGHEAARQTLVALLLETTRV